jgi:Calcineurin-like phosphoesterase
MLLFRLILPASFVIFVGLICGSASAQADVRYHWLQYTADGLEARAVSSSRSCPAAQIDNVTLAMSLRSEGGEGYPIFVCTLPVPLSAHDVRIDGFPLNMPKTQVQRILIIGDTGCRLKGAYVQACNDISQWPFRIGADLSAELKPDLVIHVGDYHYRETPCPAANIGCAGSAFGDNWDVWRSDFFEPGESLLNAAPWVMVRGNHEECERGGKGWARMLDPYRWQQDKGRQGCLGPARPFMVDLGGLTLVVADVSSADEDKMNPAQVAWYKEIFSDAMAHAGDKPMWLTFHRPIWAVDGSTGPQSGGDNKTLAAALRDIISPHVQLILSGHHHVFEALSYEQDLPAQLIAGHGGDELAMKVPPHPAGLNIDGVTIKEGIARPGIYGFSMLERRGDDPLKWTYRGYDIHAQPIGTCAIDGRAIKCD